MEVLFDTAKDVMQNFLIIDGENLLLRDQNQLQKMQSFILGQQ